MHQNNKLYVPNAGIVILKPYLSMLFERLGLLENKKFLSDELQLQAVSFLQYLVTDQEHAEAHDLILNKVICGISITTPVYEEIHINENQKKLMHGLIEAVIFQWLNPELILPNTFRESWLQRNGRLIEKSDHWELFVEKRPFDILLQHAPFSFRILNFPWMLKPLHVNWQY